MEKKSVEEVCEFIKTEFGLLDDSMLRSELIDGAALALMSEADLAALKLPLGVRLKYWKRQKEQFRLPSDFLALSFFWYDHGNMESGRKYLEQACDQGDPEAYHIMGVNYRRGYFGFQPNAKEAFKFFELSAKNGCAKGMIKLSFLLKVAKKVEESNKWAQTALLSEHPFVHGFCHFYGLGVPQNHSLAVEFYLKAALKGVMSAQYCLATCYYDGTGVIKDLFQAAKWYKRCADQNHQQGQFMWACCTYYGYGTSIDKNLAIQIWKRLTLLKDEDSRKMLEKLSREK
jgi:TPR repeat protein